MRSLLIVVRRYAGLIFLAAILLAACSAPETVTVTVEVTREVEVTVLVPDGQAGGQPAATYTPYPTHTPYPTFTPMPTFTPPPSPTPEPTAEPTVEPPAAPTETSVELPASPSQPVSGGLPQGGGGRLADLTRIPESGPRPPFTVLTSAIWVESDGEYKLTGTVRNDGSETYEAISASATFYDEHEHRFGPIDVRCPCLFIAPGEECPFSLKFSPHDYTAYHLSATGRPIENLQPATAVVSGLSVGNDGIGNVRITGVAINSNAFSVENVTIAGVLLDGNGRIVSVGSTVVLDEIAPGTSASFDLRIAYEPYYRYQLYVRTAQS